MSGHMIAPSLELYIFSLKKKTQGVLFQHAIGSKMVKKREREREREKKKQKEKREKGVMGDFVTKVPLLCDSSFIK